MITELLLSGLFGVADILLGFMPEIEWTVNTSAWQYAGDILSMICYLLPLGHITAAIAFIISLGLFRISIAFIRFVLSLIPFIG
ncbi:MAG: hypothetical protein ACI4TK_07385 [Agathobacter sp.]